LWPSLFVYSIVYQLIQTVAQPKNIFEMQTKNWPVQNMHLGEAEMHVLNGQGFFISSTKCLEDYDWADFKVVQESFQFCAA
jgi:hypothetical protein